MNTKFYTQILHSLIFLGIFSFVSITKTHAQEGAYWMRLSVKNPAAIGTPSDWVLGSYNFANLGDDEKLSGLIDLAYAYTLRFEEKGELNFGVLAGINKYETDLTNYVSHTDPNFPALENSNTKYFKSGLGMFYNSSKIDIGLSYNLFTELENNLSQNNLYSVNPTKNVFTTVCAYRFIIDERFVIEPNLMLDFYKGETDSNLGLFFNYNDFIWAGYNNLDFENIHSLMLGADINQRFRLGYNITFSKLFSAL